MKKIAGLILVGVVLVCGGLAALAQGPDAYSGSWEGLIQCRTGQTANAAVVISPSRIRAGWKGQVSFFGGGAGISADSQDGVRFSSSGSSALSPGRFVFNRIDNDQAELQVQTGNCAGRAIVLRDREDRVEDVYRFPKDGPQLWVGKQAQETINGRTFFDVLANAGVPGLDTPQPAMAAELQRLRANCTFDPVQSVTTSYIDRSQILSVRISGARFGAGGVCRDGSEVMILAASSATELSTSASNPLQPARVCTSRPGAAEFRACWSDAKGFQCRNETKIDPSFSCRSDLVLTTQETALALRRAQPRQCTVSESTFCDRLPDGKLENCRGAASKPVCTGGPETARGPLAPRANLKIGTWDEAGGAAVVDVGLCPSDFRERTGRGETLRCQCPATQGRRMVYGGMDGVFGHNSHICTAARFAGVIAGSGQGVVLVKPAPRGATNPGGERNGVISVRDERSTGSFTVEAAVASAPAVGAGVPQTSPGGAPARAAPQPQPYTKAMACPENYSLGGMAARERSCFCPATFSTHDVIWGAPDGFYSEDSKVCAAAYHAGAIPRSGGWARLTPAPARSSWPESRKNGVWARPSLEDQKPTPGFTVAAGALPSQEQVERALIGPWSGAYVAKNDPTRATQIVFEAAQSGAAITATISYPTYACSGTWTLAPDRGATFAFIETITVGADKCPSGARVLLEPTGHGHFKMIKLTGDQTIGEGTLW